MNLEKSDSNARELSQKLKLKAIKLLKPTIAPTLSPAANQQLMVLGYTTIGVAAPSMVRTVPVT